MSTSSNHVATHKLGPLGAEPEFSEMSQMVQQTVHRYAEEVMRPVGVKLDRMTPEEAIAPGSPYWEARKKFVELGFGVDGLFELEKPIDAKPEFDIFFAGLPIRRPWRDGLLRRHAIEFDADGAHDLLRKAMDRLLDHLAHLRQLRLGA